MVMCHQGEVTDPSRAGQDLVFQLKGPASLEALDCLGEGFEPSTFGLCGGFCQY